jgi:hypothetical protein
LIFSEKIIQYLRTFALQVQTSWNQPLPLKSFPDEEECNLKHLGSVDLVGRNKTKQTNYLPS